MRTRLRPSITLHALAWGILGSAFLIISAPRVWEALRAVPVGFGSPWQTTDNYTARLLKSPRGSERFLQAFATLPPNQPVALVWPKGNDEAAFLGLLTGYFGWPREVRMVQVTRADATEKLRGLDRTTLAGIFFCQLDPPPTWQPVVHWTWPNDRPG